MLKSVCPKSVYQCQKEPVSTPALKGHIKVGSEPELNLWPNSSVGWNVCTEFSEFKFFMKNKMVMQSYESIYNKKFCYEDHSRNFNKSILQDITSTGPRTKKNPGINVTSPDFMQQWYSALGQS